MSDAEATPAASAAQAGAIREEVENLLFLEAQLLDEWRLDEWLGLLTEDAAYFVPSNDNATKDSPANSHRSALYLIADDRARLDQRVLRIKSADCHAESPKSRTCRMISNIRIERVEGPLVFVAANFVCYRFRRYGRNYPFVGAYRYVLRRTDDGLRIKERKVLLASEELGALGSISFIL